METVIKLARPSDYQANEGARMTVEFTKARGIMGSDAEAFEAQLKNGEWSEKGAASARDERIIALHLECLAQRDIAVEAKCGVATVNRVVQRYKAGVPTGGEDG